MDSKHLEFDKTGFPKSVIILALPGSGKTYIAKRNANVLDTDDLLLEIGGDASRKGWFKVKEDKSLREQFAQRIVEHVGKGGSVVTNVDLFFLDRDFLAKHGYAIRFFSAVEYLDHLKRVGREDLLGKFSEKELTSWVKNFNHGQQTSGVNIIPDVFIGANHSPHLMGAIEDWLN
jgi:hypothetical protein